MKRKGKQLCFAGHRAEDPLYLNKHWRTKYFTDIRGNFHLPYIKDTILTHLNIGIHLLLKLEGVGDL